METLRRAIRNVVTQLGSQVMTWGATFLLTAALGRQLGDSGFGILYLALSFTGLFSVLIDFGLLPWLTREVARHPERLTAFLVNGLAIKLVLWAASFGAIQLSIVALDYPAQTRQVITVYAVTVGLTSLASLLAAIFRGLERLGHPSIGSILEKAIGAALGIYLLAQGAGVIEIAWVLALGAAVNVIWQLGAIAPYLGGPFSLEVRLVRQLMLGGLPFVAYNVMSTIYWRIDAVMLSKMTDEAVVGWYGAAYRLSDTLGFLPSIVAASIMMPIMSRLSRDSTEKTKLAFEKGLHILLLSGIPLCVGLVVLAGPILLAIYERPEFLNATPALQILAVGLLLEYANSATGWALVSLDRERQLLVIPTIAAVLNIALNLFFIPLWQHSGAALATVICEALIGIGFLIALPKWLLSRASLLVALKSMLAAAGMAIVLLAAEQLPVIVLIPLGIVTYFALVALLRIVPRDDVALLRQAMARRGASARAEGLEPV